jgi:hypothetical protein
MTIEYQTKAASVHANLAVVQQMNYPQLNTVLFIALPDKNFTSSPNCVALWKVKKR